MSLVNIYHVLQGILETIEPGNCSYTVFPSLHQSCSIPFFCTCPAFSYAVLISHSQITCKHVLATLIAQRLSKCVVREMNKHEFVALLTRQISET
ncbi:hypothetical protein BGY98DRAFT_968377 [Russula aff. rugulosa BPL654]|nr:hypothetical protein BGY98DRAFT_968377 [Russula aff. rugulosa BPL654]